MLQGVILLVIIPLKIIQLSTRGSPYWDLPYKRTIETGFAEMKTKAIDEIRIANSTLAFGCV